MVKKMIPFIESAIPGSDRLTVSKGNIGGGFPRDQQLQFNSPPKTDK
jgi:hypothetical protein